MSYVDKVRLTIEDRPCFLYVTDESETARSLKNRGEKVLIFLHEGNRSEDFSGFPYCTEDTDQEEAYFEGVYRRLAGIPWTICETEEYLVRESVVSDAAAFYDMYREPGAMRFVPERKESPEETEEALREYIRYQYPFYEYGLWTVLDKATGEIVGRAGFSLKEEAEYPDLGYLVTEKRQGQGIAVKVGRALLSYAAEHLEFEKVLLFAEKENVASLKVAEKLGFRPIGQRTVDGMCVKAFEYDVRNQ